MRVAARFLVACAVLAAVGVSGFWLARRDRARPSVAALQVAPESLDFGEVWSSPRHRVTVPVRNVARFPVQVVKIGAGCTCTEVEPQSFRLDPGEQVDLRVALNLEKSERTSPRDFQVEIIPVANRADVVQPVWVLKGRVREVVERCPPELQIRFPEVESGEPRQPERWTIRCADSGARLEATLGEEIATIGLEPAEKSPDLYELWVLPSSKLARGRHTGIVTITPRGSTAASPREVPLVIDVVRDLRMEPAALPLGDVAVGESISRELTLSTLTGRPLPAYRMTAVVPGDAPVTAEIVEPLAHPAAHQGRARLVCKPLRAGSHVVKIDVVAEGPVAEGPTKETFAVYVSYLARAGRAPVTDPAPQ